MTLQQFVSPGRDKKRLDITYIDRKGQDNKTISLPVPKEDPQDSWKGNIYKGM